MVCTRTLYREAWAGNLPLGITELPEAVKLYTEGVGLVKQCKDSLDKVEKELIILEENGEEHEL